jgi:CBS domain-containing protein
MILVQHILADARQRMAVLNEGAPISDAAEILTNPNIPLVIVCDSEGVAVGVISRTDLLKAFSRARGNACNTNAEAIMTRTVFSCHVDQTLQSVWGTLNARSLRCAPVLDNSRKPLGVVHARDIARALVDEVTGEEELLRDYVMGIGYQ